MPYGLFDYGGTINTMGESPTVEWMNERGGGNLMVTKAIPEEARITTAALFEEGNPYTDKAPEDGPIPPVTLRMPEDGMVPPPTGGTGGCPAGYAPAQASPPSQYRDPVLPGPVLGFHQNQPDEILYRYVPRG